MKKPKKTRFLSEKQFMRLVMREVDDSFYALLEKSESPDSSRQKSSKKLLNDVSKALYASYLKKSRSHPS